MPPWQVFTEKASRTPTEPTITIHKDRTITVNAAAMEHLGNPQFCIYEFDPEKRRIALTPVNGHVPHAYKLHRGSHSGSFALSAGVFLRYHKVPHEKTKAYPAYPEGKRLVIDLE